MGRNTGVNLDARERDVYLSYSRSARVAQADTAAPDPHNHTQTACMSAWFF